MPDIAKHFKFYRLANAAAAGQTAVNSSSIDTAGYDGVVLVTAFGAITSGGAQSVKIQDGATSSPTTDVEGSSVTVADDDDNQIVVHDVYKPQKRYLRVVVSRATQDSVVDGIFAFLYQGRLDPQTNDTTTVCSLKSLISAAEGTA